MEAVMEEIMEDAEFIPFVDKHTLDTSSRINLWMKAVSSSRAIAEYEMIDGHPYLVLHQNYKIELTHTCLFCAKKHKHD